MKKVFKVLDFVEFVELQSEATKLTDSCRVLTLRIYCLGTTEEKDKKKMKYW